MCLSNSNYGGIVPDEIDTDVLCIREQIHSFVCLIHQRLRTHTDTLSHRPQKIITPNSVSSARHSILLFRNYHSYFCLAGTLFSS